MHLSHHLVKTTESYLPIKTSVETIGSPRNNDKKLSATLVKLSRFIIISTFISKESDSDSEKDEEIKIITMENSTRKFDYVFQHPIPRLMITYIGVFLSWLLIAEDPIGHSLAPAKVDVLGNAYSLIFGK